MPLTPPRIDRRSFEDLVRETEELAERFTEGAWRPAPAGRLDPGGALIRAFGRMAEVVVQRLNRAPEKHFLAFLDLIGARPSPARSARAPLTFALSAGAPGGGFVPAETHVAAPALDGGGEVVFETEGDLVLHPTRLVAAFGLEPDRDRWADRTEAATGALDEPFEAFAAERQIEHALYLRVAETLPLEGAESLTLTLMSRSNDARRFAALPVVWEHLDGEVWRPLTVQSAAPSQGTWRVTIEPPAAWEPGTLEGLEGLWLRARLELPLPPDQGSPEDPPRLRRRERAPDAVVVGQTAIDPNRSFLAFGSGSNFYLRCDEAFALGGATVSLGVTLATRGEAARGGVQLSLTGLGAGTAGAIPLGGLADATAGLTRDGEISFSVPEGWAPRELPGGGRGRWLRVSIEGSGYEVRPRIGALAIGYDWRLPRLHRIDTVATLKPPTALPDLGFANTQPLDLSKDFYPFGERPRRGDTFYLASAAAFSLPGARVDLRIENSQGHTAKARNSTVVWETWNGRRWERITASGPARLASATPQETVGLTLPATVAPTAVHGQENYWVRARIVAGDYGEEARYVEDGGGGWKLQAATLAPPSLASVRLSWEHAITMPPAACRTRNDFAWTDHGADLAAQSLFAPFAPTVDRRLDTRPALYLGFEKAFANRAASIYFAIRSARHGELEEDANVGDETAAAPVLVWEYFGPAGWTPLAVLDGTRGLTRGGLVSFLGPADALPAGRFAREAFWLRVRWDHGVYAEPPRIGRVLINTVWAAQHETRRDEVLGSGTGEPGQRFDTPRAPVLGGQRIEVREREAPSTGERTAIEALEGEDAVRPATGRGSRPGEVWVRWHEVPDFHASGPHDRHYVFDHAAGEVRFGDGRRGQAPPRGRHNVRAAVYRIGGGERGNVAAGSITQLKAAVPYVDAAVNHEPAAGGSDFETLEELALRGPAELRHRGRAVALEDFEDLARDASFEVARVRAAAPPYDPFDEAWIEPYGAAAAGRVRLVVVARSKEVRPAPKVALLRQVQEHLLAHCSPTVDVEVAGPEWVAVSVDALLAPSSLAAAEGLAARAEAALARFLHPLTGGEEGSGWSFGRRPHLSDLYGAIGAVEGLDHVVALSVRTEPEVERLPPEDRDDFLIHSGRHRIRLAAPPEEG